MLRDRSRSSATKAHTEDTKATTAMANETTFRWISSARTDVGCVRKINEDACLDRAEDGLWVVADGMGGHAAGDVASGRIIEQINAFRDSLPEIQPVKREMAA